MADNNPLTTDYAECLLHWLVHSNRYFHQFRARLGDPDERVSDGNTLLHAAAASQMSNSRILTLLIDWGANVNKENRFRDTPLHFAVASRNLNNVIVLLRAGAYPNHWGSFGRTPLHLAVCGRRTPRTLLFPISDCDMSVVERLLRHPRIRVNRSEKSGETPLMWAVRDLNVSAVSVLLKKGADPNIPNSVTLRTPLHVAFYSPRVWRSSRARNALTLLENGAGIYCLDKFQLTPIDLLLSNVVDEPMLVFAAYCLKRIAFRCNVTESLRNQLIPIPYLDHCLSAFLEEVELMKELVVCDNFNLHDFALGCFPSELGHPIEDVYLPVVETLLVISFEYYHKPIFRRISKSSMGDVLNRCLGLPPSVGMDPTATKKTIFRNIRYVYEKDKALQKRLERFDYLFEE